MTGQTPVIHGAGLKQTTYLGAALAAVAVTLALAPSAASAAPCPELAVANCTRVTVPVDRAGAVPGTINLAVARMPAPRQPSRGTILFLAGGPGESALSGLEDLAGLYRRYAPNYDLLTFDQRGTGRSGGLTCGALSGRGSETSVFARCGRQIGARRGFYRTTDTVADIEAVRTAAGGGPVSILGVSYGGRVAGEYVRRYPAAVSRMVLDSPSTLQGTDPFSRQRQVALPRVLRSICGNACRSFTRSPIRDTARVAARLARKSLRTYLVTPGGRRTKVRFGAPDLYGLLTLSDLDPVTRARLPGSIAAARRGDGAPLARALTGTLSALGSPAQQVGPVSDALFAATTCAEAPLPWSPASAPDGRRDRATAARVRQLGPRAFAPFGSRTVLSSSFLGQCRRWPAVAPSAQAPAAGPAVPTLVINGAEDLRTPAEEGRQLAGGYPGGRALVIPATGHSAITTDPSRCAPRAAFGFLAGAPAPTRCRPVAREVPTAGRPPLSLRGVGGRTAKARTLRAVRLTGRDLITAVLSTATQRFGGLRGGRAIIRVRPLRVTLAAYQYVPKVRVSGTLRRSRGRLVGSLRVWGGGAVPARVTLTHAGNLKARFLAKRAPSASASLAGAPLRWPARPRRPVAAGPSPLRR